MLITHQLVISRWNISIGGFDETLTTAEDIDLFLRLAFRYRTGFLNIKLVNIFQSDDSLGSGLRNYDDNLKVLTRAVENNVEYFNSRKKIVSEVLGNLFVASARNLIWQRETKSTRTRLISSMK